MMEESTQLQPAQAPSLIAKIAARYAVDATKLMGTLKLTAFKQRGENPPPTDEQMMMLLIVADQYRLNPFTREIYAFPDSDRGIVPVVGVDGWARLVNEHPQCDGVEFEYGPEADESNKGAPEWIDCIIHRKDRAHPTRVREVLAECRRDTRPWGSHPQRMLRHKAFVQAARLAFGFVGVFDEDEAQRIVERDITSETTVERVPLRDQVKRRSEVVPPKADVPVPAEYRLRGCQTLAELGAVWKSLSPAHKRQHTALKDRIKNGLTEIHEIDRLDTEHMDSMPDETE